MEIKIQQSYNVENKRIREINQAKMIDIKNNSNNKISQYFFSRKPQFI